MDEITLPITLDDLQAWRDERDEIKPQLDQYQRRYQILLRRIDAAEFLIKAREAETPSAPAEKPSDRSKA